MLQVDPASVGAGGGGPALSWDAGSARAAGFAEGTGSQAPALPGLSHPWVTPTGRHLHDADEVPAANVQWEEGQVQGGCQALQRGLQVDDDNATGRLWQLAAQIELQPPTLAPCTGLHPP